MLMLLDTHLHEAEWYLASEVIAVSTHGFWLSMAFNIGPYLATEVYNCYYPHHTTTINLNKIMR